jgi:lipid-A-disaccharide synthase
MKIFFSAGEPSGDLHGANLIREFRRRRPDFQATGYGGPKMAQAGARLHYDLTALAVMWFLRVLLNLHKFFWLLWRADRCFLRDQPDAVVLIDYPGFNWWIARRAKARGIPVYYYAPPQIWAWASWRVKKVQRFVDHVLCALPFEETWFRAHGCRATFVGHPYFDEVRTHTLDAAFLAAERAKPGPLVTILPGSRTQEVHKNFRFFLQATVNVRQRVPEARFAVAAFKPHQAEIARAAIAQAGLPIEVHTGRTPELIHLATCCMAVSGSVSLELLYHGRPTVILYWIGRLAYWVQERFRRVKYITLVNLLASRELYPADITPYDDAQPDAASVPFPEYLTGEDKSAAIAAHITRWLTDPSARAAKEAQLAELRARVAHGGATQAAVELILSELEGNPAPIPRPHFSPVAARADAA